MWFSEIAGTAPTNSYWVTASTALMMYTPFTRFRSPWCTVSTRRYPGSPFGSGALRSPIVLAAGRVWSSVVCFDR